MSGVVRWEEPPHSSRVGWQRKSRGSRFERVAQELRGRPGEWAVVFEGPQHEASAMPTHIRYGQVACFTPSGDFDATSRTRAGVTTVYARYVGDGGCE